VWHTGYHETLLKRAELEDAWVSMLADIDRPDVAKVAALLLRFDTELGLTPMAAAKLHYAFVDEPEPPKAVESVGNVTSMRDRLKGMRE
jgi:hypothetical protein